MITDRIPSNPILSILHVYTLTSDVGEYGGPTKVAHELGEELAKRGHSVKLLSGTRSQTIKVIKEKLTFEFIKVRSLVNTFQISSLFSIKIIYRLFIEIKRAQIIHIHLGREIIPIVATIICVIRKKVFFVQTHGMCVPNSRIFIRLLDKFLMIPLINRSKGLIVLTEQEKKQMTEYQLKIVPVIIPNGIKTSGNVRSKRKSEVIEIVFCSRIHPQKGVFKFVEVAELFYKEKFFENKINFRIYGPDAGILTDLTTLINDLDLPNLEKNIRALSQEEVMDILSKSDVLVLPSSNDLYPMIVIEALSVGISVLVMPSCGFASELSKLDSNFVAPTEDALGIAIALKRLIEGGLRENSEITRFTKEYFGIEKVVDRLEQLYCKNL